MYEAGLNAATLGTPSLQSGLGDGGLLLGAPNTRAGSVATGNVVKILSGWDFPASARQAIESGTGVCVGFSNVSGSADKGKVTAFTRTHAEEVRTLLGWLRMIPGFPNKADLFSIQINKDAVLRKHRDRNNVGSSWFCRLGNFTNGELMIDNGEGFTPLESLLRRLSNGARRV